jgi:hypothetical protein
MRKTYIKKKKKRKEEKRYEINILYILKKKNLT